MKDGLGSRVRPPALASDGGDGHILSATPHETSDSGVMEWKCSEKSNLFFPSS